MTKERWQVMRGVRVDAKNVAKQIRNNNSCNIFLLCINNALISASGQFVRISKIEAVRRVFVRKTPQVMGKPEPLQAYNEKRVKSKTFYYYKPKQG
jgi:hypothetical protein